MTHGAHTVIPGAFTREFGPKKSHQMSPAPSPDVAPAMQEFRRLDVRRKGSTP